MTPKELMDKATRALASARLLLDAGDTDGSCNRAYYAMFDAARAALLEAGRDVAENAVRTHSGRTGSFKSSAMSVCHLRFSYFEHGYKLAEIAHVAGVHYSTVSKVINQC